jgi:hypothetical protein
MAKTMDRVSYGEPLFTGKGMTAKPRPETMNALMSVAPMAQAAPGLAKGATALGQAALRNALIPSNVPMQAQRGAIVYHGSPHTFDKFDMSKIGTGEGAQAYGHGLYLADSPIVAGEYQKTLASGKLIGFDPKRHGAEAERDVRQLLLMQKDNPRQFAEVAGDRSSYLGKIATDIKQGRLKADEGNLYKVDLPDEHIAKMLDWDKPLSQQSPAVQRAVSESSDPMMRYWAQKSAENPAYDGADLLQRLGGEKGDRAAAAEKLRQAGIPGIKYLDQGSRGAGAGTRNYVVLDDKLPRILERNGKSLTEQLADALKGQ